jgi:hypothetical protein
MTMYEKSSLYMALVGALAPKSTTPNCAQDARKMALAEVLSGLFTPVDDFWTPGMLLTCSDDLRVLVDVGAPYGPALVDRREVAASLGDWQVASKVLGLAGFHPLNGLWSDADQDADRNGEPVRVAIPTMFFSDEMRDRTDEMGELRELYAAEGDGLRWQ